MLLGENFYEYDAENIRTAVITNGIRTEYTTDRESTYSRVLIKTEYEKNFLGFYTEQRARTVYTYGIGLVSERRDDGEEYYYHYNHIGSTMAVSDGAGNVIYRFVYDTYGELSDIQTDDGISLKTAEVVQDAVKDITLAELADATGIEYLYNGQYGVTTDRNGLYYMRARYYDQDIKRFINRDVVSGDITNSLSLNRYCYVQGNPVSLADPFGLCPDGNSTMQGLANSMMGTMGGMFNIAGQVNGSYNSSSYFGHMLLSQIGNYWHGADIINEVWYAAERNYDAISTYGHAALDLAGIVWDGADVINAVWYAAEGNYDMAVVSGICALPFVGNIVGGSAGIAMKMIGHSLTFAMATEGTIEAVGRAVDAYEDGTLSWWNALDVGVNALGMGLAGRATYFSGKQLASCVASSDVGQKISNSIRRLMADDRGCVELYAFRSGRKTKTLYHYTNEEGMNAIVDSQKLNPSLKANNPKDARYGNGQYLSDIKPNTHTPAQLAKEFINVPNKYKYTHYVEIDVTDLNVIKGRDGVFVIPNELPLDLRGRIVSTGAVGTN